MTGRAGRIMRRAAFAFLGLAAIVIVAASAGALTPRPLFLPTSNEALPAGEPVRRALVLSGPIHTDIAVPADPDVLARFAFLREDGLPIDLDGVEWLVFGWGGRSFYLETPTWADLKPGPVARALTLDRAAMHVSVAGPIDPQLDGVLALDLTETQFERLIEGMETGFTLAAGRPVPIEGRSYGEYDLFYEGAGWFNALMGCNLWAASTLRAAGLRTGWWNPLPQSLVWSLHRHNPSLEQRAF